MCGEFKLLSYFNRKKDFILKNFTDIEELVSYMYEKVEDGYPVTVIADKDMTIDIMQEFLLYDNTNLVSVELDTYEYDKEYQVVLTYDSDDETYRFYVNFAYDYETKKYYGMDGIVLFHEDVNSKALVDMQSNECAYMTEHDWFTFDNDVDESEDDEVSDEEDTEVTENKDRENKYFLNGKPVTKEEYTRAYDIFQEKFEKAVLGYCEFMDEMNEWRKLLRW